MMGGERCPRGDLASHLTSEISGREGKKGWGRVNKARNIILETTSGDGALLVFTDTSEGLKEKWEECGKRGKKSQEGEDGDEASKLFPIEHRLK